MEAARSEAVEAVPEATCKVHDAQEAQAAGVAPPSASMALVRQQRAPIKYTCSMPGFPQILEKTL